MIYELLSNPVFAGAAGTAIGGVVAAVAGVFTTRTNKAPDIQASLNAAVAGITKHYQEALDQQRAQGVAAMQQIEAMRAEVASLKATIELQTETISELENHIDELTAAMTKAGVTPPIRRKRD